MGNNMMDNFARGNNKARGFLRVRMGRNMRVISIKGRCMGGVCISGRGRGLMRGFGGGIGERGEVSFNFWMGVSLKDTTEMV